MKLKLLTYLGAVLGVVCMLVSVPPVQAQDIESHNDQQSAQQQPAGDQEAAPAQPKTYNYTAKAGDSYSVLARKAVQTYGIETQTNLSGAQIVYIETNLTLAAGSPELEVGQAVSIAESAVKEWVEKAKTLSAEDAAAWDYYVQFVDFNTNNNG